MKALKQIGFWLLLGVVFLFSVFPLYWILSASFKTRADVVSTTADLHSLCRF